MREYILSYNEKLLKLSLDGKSLLTLTESVNGQISAKNVIFPQTCVLFSSDIDLRGTLHTVAVTRNTLTYLKTFNGRTATTHLMHLPEKFTVTGVNICADKDIRLHYAVKGEEGTAIIEYTLSGDEWKGKNLYTSEFDVKLLCVKKGCEECYICISATKSNKIINVYDGKEIASFSQIPEYAQSTKNGIVFAANGNIYINENEITQGNAVYVLDSERLLINQNGKLKEIICAPVCRPSGEAFFPQNAREYFYCSSESDKRIIISSPFPYISCEPQKSSGSGIMQEVYMQQRAIFSLQAEIKEIKNRLRILEEDRKKHN